MIGGLVHLQELHILAADDRDDDALGPCHADPVKQRIGNRLFGSLKRAVGAFAFAGAHHCLAHFAHHRTHIGKVEVDEARHHHQIGDRAHALLEHFIGKLKGFLESGFRLGDQKQVLIGNDDQRINMALKFINASFGRAHPAGSLKQERLGNNTHCEHTHAAGGLGNNGRSARAGATTHASGNKAHVDAFERLFNVRDGFFGGRLAHFGTRACTQTAGDIRTQLNALFRRRSAQRLRIGVGDDEFDAFDLRSYHVGNRIAACAANADHGDARTHVVNRCRSDIDAHQLVLQPRIERTNLEPIRNFSL